MNAVTQFERLPGVSAGVYAEADFVAVRELVYQEAGIVLPVGKAMLVYSRLAPLVRARGSGTFAAYIATLDQDASERHKAICALTTNHTAFFREAHHFDHLGDEVRTDLLDRLRAGEAIRLWSSACSSGEEAWSMAATLLGADRAQGKAIARSDMVILATDLADHALATARAARYPASSVAPMPEPLRRAWTTQAGDMTTMAPELVSMVRFRPLNLLGPWPIKRQFDVIFCRNVMIYFDQPTKERLLSRFADQILPGGFLYIGHSERVTGPAAQSLLPVGNTIYRKVG